MTSPPVGSNHKKSKTADSRPAQWAIPVRNGSELFYSADDAFFNPAKFRQWQTGQAGGLPMAE
jgi:hypothetical protein